MNPARPRKAWTVRRDCRESRAYLGREIREAAKGDGVAS